MIKQDQSELMKEFAGKGLCCDTTKYFKISICDKSFVYKFSANKKPYNFKLATHCFG